MAKPRPDCLAHSATRSASATQPSPKRPQAAPNCPNSPRDCKGSSFSSYQRSPHTTSASTPLQPTPRRRRAQQPGKVFSIRQFRRPSLVRSCCLRRRRPGNQARCLPRAVTDVSFPLIDIDRGGILADGSGSIRQVSTGAATPFFIILLAGTVGETMLSNLPRDQHHRLETLANTC